MENSSRNTANNLVIVGLILAALYFGKALIIPFVIALVVWYLLNSLRNLVARIKFKNKELPQPLQLILSGLFLASATFFLGKILMNNFENFVEEYPRYHRNILQMSHNITKDFDLPVSVSEYIQKLNVPNILSRILNSSLDFVTDFFLVFVYVIFLILEQRIFYKKIKLFFDDRKKLYKFLATTKKIDESIHSYISVKTSLCLLAGVAAYIVLIILEIDFAILWAFLIFLFNYIPIIGVLGIFFPTIIAFVQYPNTYFYGVMVLILLAAIQVVIGNFIEPKTLGERLNLSPLVVILALMFWGALWGIAGMFLCVPITVIMMIIFSQFEKTKKIAIMLAGGKGI